MTCGCQPRHQLGRLYAGYAGYEHGANRVRHPNAFAELGRCQPALVFFAKAQTVEDGEYLLGRATCTSCWAAAMMQAP